VPMGLKKSEIIDEINEFLMRELPFATARAEG